MRFVGSLTWESRLPLKPAFTFGYARGSADSELEPGLDRSFRQTGLQRNKVKYAGVESYRVYGEILDPELSNLEVGTFVVGFPLLRSSSLDFAAHLYRQCRGNGHGRQALELGELRIGPLCRNR